MAPATLATNLPGAACRRQVTNRTRADTSAGSVAPRMIRVSIRLLAQAFDADGDAHLVPDALRHGVHAEVLAADRERGLEAGAMTTHDVGGAHLLDLDRER